LKTNKILFIMSLIKSISGIRGTIGGTKGENLTPEDIVKFTSAYALWIKRQSAKNRVKVLIGTEVDFPDISECSLILSHYGTESQVLGSLGIIGPKRLPYKKIIPLVECVAKQLSQTFSHNQ